MTDAIRGSAASRFTAHVQARLQQALAPSGGPGRSHRAADILGRNAPDELGPLPKDLVGKRGGPQALRRGTPLGDLSACDDGASIERVIAKHKGPAVRLVLQLAPQLLARIAANDKLDADTKVAHLLGLVNTVATHRGKVDFVTNEGQMHLKDIITPLRHTPGIHPDQIARLLTALEDLPKEVTFKQAMSLMGQAHGPGWRAPDFAIFQKYHAKNHAPGEQGGWLNKAAKRYEYPHGVVFPLHADRTGPSPRLHAHHGILQAMPLAGFVHRRDV